MNGETGMIILYIIMGFFGFITILCGTLFWIFWNRRKLIFTNFLDSTGQWRKIGWKPNKIDKNFTYDGEEYLFDIEKCTRDNINRPVAHYYKGNPEQQIFDVKKGRKTLVIDTQEITFKDFCQLMASKVIKDIFSDDEVMNWLLAIFITVLLMGVIIIICIFAKSQPPVHLINDNETINLIADGVKQAITNARTG